MTLKNPNFDKIWPNPEIVTWKTKMLTLKTRNFHEILPNPKYFFYKYRHNSNSTWNYDLKIKTVTINWLFRHRSHMTSAARGEGVSISLRTHTKAAISRCEWSLNNSKKWPCSYLIDRSSEQVVITDLSDFVKLLFSCGTGSERWRQEHLRKPRWSVAHDLEFWQHRYGRQQLVTGKSVFWKKNLNFF